MTPRQRILARHALGLSNTQRTSYRNRFIASENHTDYPDWIAMTHGAQAVHIKRSGTAGDLFYLTHTGAQAALDMGDRLSIEDFPGLGSFRDGIRE